MSNELIAWKTSAWKDPAMVQWYAGQMVESSGANRIKNAVEVGLIEAHAIGANVLDVGIGTGRGSLPLLQRGLHVTGVDSSQAMLDETRRQAGGRPIELKVGDVVALPFADRRFDTVIALNVLVHFPHWREVLAHWCRFLAPGGRVIFDIHSRDHFDAALGAGPAEARLSAQATAAYISTAKGAELCAEATRLGLAVVGILPYGAVLGGGNTNLWWSDRLEARADWRRLVGWAEEDDALFAFACWLEEAIVWQLPTCGTGRLMVILEQSDDCAARNRQWSERHERKLRDLGNAPAAAAMLEIVGFDAARRGELAAHLEHPRNRAMAFRMLQALAARWDKHDWWSAVPAQQALFDRWRRQDLCDRQAMTILQRWAAPPFPPLESCGVALAPGLDYQLIGALLNKHFEAFSQQ
jgi:SAM-dependent methyltransferase